MTWSRSTALGIAYNLAVMIFGGFAQFFVTWLIEATGSPLAPSFYVMFGAAIGVVATFFLIDRAWDARLESLESAPAATSSSVHSPLYPGGFNRSAQHLILRGEEVCHGDVADLVHGSAESRAVGAMEERAKCCGDLSRGRWKGRTRPALSGSWYCMEVSGRRRAGEPWQH